jgi:Domain of unknown function (DUF4386)
MTTHPDHAAPGGSAWVNARLAGVLYLVIIVFGLFSEVLVRRRLTVTSDPAGTAANIRDSAWLFRLGFAANLVFILCEVALVVILYLLFRPVSRIVSLVAAAFRLTSLPIYALNLVNMFGALVVLDDADYLTGSTDGREETALFFLELHHYGFAIGLTFFGVNSLFMGYLLAKSSHVPAALGVLLSVAGVGYLVNSFAYFIIPGYQGSATPIFLAPALVAEVWFCAFLLWRGGGLAEWDEPAPTPTERLNLGGDTLVA